MDLFKEIAFDFLRSALWIGGGSLLYFVIERFRSRHERWFWSRFKKGKLHIILREYSIAGFSSEEMGAKITGDGFQITKGMALAMSRLMSFCQARVTDRNSIAVSGDQSCR